MRCFRQMIALLSGLALAAPACAATLGSIEGTVTVNRGGGFQHASGTLELKPGDSVIVNAGGNAQLTYEDGCNVMVEVGAIVTVAEQSPCATQTTGATNTTGPTFMGLGGTGLVVLNAGIAAGAVAFFLANQDKDKAASP
jgi:hypothetical protein